MLTGQNGILNRAQEAKENTETANKEEQRKLAQAEALMNTETTTYKGITLPEGFAPTKASGEDSIDDGLVITDGAGNEFVWVEVPKTVTVYQTAGLNITEFTDEEYTKIEADLHTYTNDYRNGTTYKDVYYQDSTEGWFKEEQYNELKQKMLRSVYQNGGFWISRYEAGIDEFRVDSGEATKTPLSKANLYPYTSVTRTQAEALSEKVESGNCTSSLLFGVQWDLVLKYIETKKNSTDSEIQNELNVDGKKIGNYRNSEFILERGKFAKNKEMSKWHNFDSEDMPTLVTGKKKLSQTEELNEIILTTGATKSTSLQNIYDIAGNVWEWTLEKTDNNEYPCTFRGGYFGINGNQASASYRSWALTSQNFYDIGFRIAIY